MIKLTEGDYVRAENVLETEVFLNLCEEQNINTLAYSVASKCSGTVIPKFWYIDTGIDSKLYLKVITSSDIAIDMLAINIHEFTLE
jgi:hypothetical protein